MTKNKKKGRKKGKKNGITPRVRKFIDFFVESGNATQSAIKAGYSKNGANRAASRLLAKVDIQEEITKKNTVLAEQAGVTAQKVIDELAKIAFLRSSDVFKYDKQEVELANGVKVTRGVALLKPHNELSEAADCAIASIKETNQGLEIKLYDKQKALDSLGRYFGITNEAEVEKQQKIKGAERQAIVDPAADATEEEIDKRLEELEE